MVNHETRWLFVSTTKCATRTMYAVLPKFGFERTGGFHGRPGKRFADYHKFAVCRNPLSRAVSTWWSTCMRDHDRYGFKKAMGEGNWDYFPTFVKWLTCEDVLRHPLTCTQSDWHRDTGVEMFLRMESLTEDFLHMPFVDGDTARDMLGRALPVEGATRPLREPWQHYHTPETVDLLATWAAEDFERFGYEVVVC